MRTECAGTLCWVWGWEAVETGEVGSGTVELILTHTGVHVSCWETALFSLRTVCMLADILWCQKVFLTPSQLPERASETQPQWVNKPRNHVSLRWCFLATQGHQPTKDTMEMGQGGFFFFISFCSLKSPEDMELGEKGKNRGKYLLGSRIALCLENGEKTRL